MEIQKKEPKSITVKQWDLALILNINNICTCKHANSTSLFGYGYEYEY